MGTNPMTTATNFFRTQRDKLGLTQRRVAIALDVTVQAVSSWERGETFPRMAMIERLATVYQVTPERIGKEVIAMARLRQTVPA